MPLNKVARPSIFSLSDEELKRVLAARIHAARKKAKEEQDDEQEEKSQKEEGESIPLGKTTKEMERWARAFINSYGNERAKRTDSRGDALS